jgi:prepilin signal peptidase PulO-like enzyme (type II secretory pathway)
MQVLYISFCGLTIFQVTKKWREDKNTMYLVIILYIVLLVLISLIYIMAIFTEFHTSIVIGGNLTVGLALAFFTNTIQVEFVLYLRKYNKLYTLPLIATLYIAFGLLLNTSTILFVLYSVVVGFGFSSVLIRDGKKQRNGLAMGMGLFLLIYGIGAMLRNDLLLDIFRVAGVVVFYISSTGFFEKYVFVNEETEKRIMGTWISKLVVTE